MLLTLRLFVYGPFLSLKVLAARNCQIPELGRGFEGYPVA